jgi:hypothetical protein
MAGNARKCNSLQPIARNCYWPFRRALLVWPPCKYSPSSPCCSPRRKPRSRFPRGIWAISPVSWKSQFLPISIWTGPDLQVDGKRWAGMVGARIVRESGQPRELVAFAMTEAAKERAGHVMVNDTGSACLRQMSAELAVADAAKRPLPKPQKAQ